MSVFSCMKLPTASLYDRICGIYEYQTVEDQSAGIDKTEEMLKYQDVPCRISYQTIPTTEQTDTGAKLTQTIKLFCAPEITITAGSKIVSGEEVYAAAGEPAKYESHQEVELVLRRSWA